MSEPTVAYDAHAAGRYRRADHERWVKRLSVLVHRLDPPPVEVAWRVGRGVHLLLYRPDRTHRHVELRPRGASAEAFARTATAVVRFHGDDPVDHERTWVRGVVAALQRVEREPGFAEWLAWAEQRPSPSIPVDGRGKKHTSGTEALVRLLEPCQARCAFCSCRSDQPDMVAGFDEVTERLRDAREAGFEDVAFTGGEPTLVRQLPDFVAQARELGFRKITIQTNAIRLADRGLVETLKQAGLNAVLQSLHSHRAEVHEAIFRIPGCFEDCVAGARNVAEAGLVLGLNHVTTTQNVDGLEDYVRWVHGLLGTHPYVTFSMMSPQGWGLQHQHLIPRIRDFAWHLAPALDAARALGISAHVPGLCGVPLCTVPGYEDHFLEYTEPDPPKLATRTYADGCRDCRWRERCSGYWTDYLARYGSEELVPVPRP